MGHSDTVLNLLRPAKCFEGAHPAALPKEVAKAAHAENFAAPSPQAGRRAVVLLGLVGLSSGTKS